MDDQSKQLVLAQFVEIIGQPVEQCRQYLEATSWQLEDAVQLFFAGGFDAAAPAAAAPPSPPPASAEPPLEPMNTEPAIEGLGEDFVRPPLPVKREALYEDIFQYNRAQRRGAPEKPIPVDAFRNFDDEFKSRNTGSSTNPNPHVPTLATMYRPPLELNFEGTFEQAKSAAAKQGKWLLINVQSHTEFASHMLNRDTWAHEAVKDTVGTTFIFWQIYDDTEEGKKVCTYYRLVTMPTILILDPLTGQRMKCWEGMVSAERLLEDLVQFMDRGPMEQAFVSHTQKRARGMEHQQQQAELAAKAGDAEEDEELRKALAASMEGMPVEPAPTKNASEAENKSRVKYPALPEEPRPNEAETCRIGVRFPDGKRGQRRYHRSDPLTYLWSYCCLNVKEAADGRRFRLTHTIPGASGSLEYDPSVTMAEAGVANSILVMVWD